MRIHKLAHERLVKLTRKKITAVVQAKNRF